MADPPIHQLPPKGIQFQVLPGQTNGCQPPLFDLENPKLLPRANHEHLWEAICQLAETSGYNQAVFEKLKSHPISILSLNSNGVANSSTKTSCHSENQWLDFFSQQVFDKGLEPSLIALNEGRIPNKWVNEEDFKEGCVLDFEALINKHGDAVTNHLSPRTQQIFDTIGAPQRVIREIVGLYKTFLSRGYGFGIFSSPKECPWGPNWGNVILIKTSLVDKLNRQSIKVLHFDTFHQGKGIMYKEGVSEHVEYRNAVSFVMNFDERQPIRILFTHLEVWDPTHGVAINQIKEVVQFMNQHKQETQPKADGAQVPVDQLIFGDLNSLCRDAYSKDELETLKNNNLKNGIEERCLPLDLLIENGFEIDTVRVKMEVWSNRAVSHYAFRSAESKQTKRQVHVMYKEITDHAVLGYSIS